MIACYATAAGTLVDVSSGSDLEERTVYDQSSGISSEARDVILLDGW